MTVAPALKWPAGAAAAAALLYAAVLDRLTRGIGVDSVDGVIGLLNILRWAGMDMPGSVETTRPPLSWFLFAPGIARAYESGGAPAALSLAQACMIGVAALLAAAGFLFFRTLVRGREAAVAALALALNPLVLANAPFFRFDLLSALLVIPFLFCAFNHADDPSPRRWAALLGVYLAGYLCRYQFLIFWAVPVVYLAVRPDGGDARRRWKAFWEGGWWLLPPAGYAAGLLLNALLGGGGGEQGFFRSMSFGHEKFMELVVGGNLSGKSGWVDWGGYAKAVPRFLGWPAALLMGLGLWDWAARGGGRGRFLLIAFLVPLAALNAIPTRELRYLIILFPAAFAAFGQGLSRAGELLSPRWPLAASLAPWLFLAALPWEASREAAVWLAREPSLRPPVLAAIRSELERSVPAGGCAAFKGDGAMLLSWLPVVGRDDQPVWINDLTLNFYTGRRIVPEGSPEAASCVRGLEVTPARLQEAAEWRSLPAGLRFSPESKRKKRKRA